MSEKQFKKLIATMIKTESNIRPKFDEFFSDGFDKTIKICGFCGKLIFEFEDVEYYLNYNNKNTDIRALHYPEW